MISVFQKSRKCIALILLMTGSVAYSQKPSSLRSQDTPILDFRPDTLFFATLTERDSIWVHNVGKSDLFIDSIKTANFYGWDTNVVAPEDTFWLTIPYYIYHEELYRHFPIRIPSQDSALFVFAPPDLCPVCKVDLAFAPFEDALYFFSNDTQNSPSVLFAHGEGFTTVSDRPNDLSSAFKLEQNYPNPFNPTTRIDFSVPRLSYVQVFIYNLHGQEIRTVAHSLFQTGEHSVEWDGKDQNGKNVASGVYFCRLISGKVSISRRLMLLR